jgi:hypothetical protein
VLPVADHEMEVVVGFVADEHHPDGDGEDVLLERQPRVRQASRRRA